MSAPSESLADFFAGPPDESLADAARAYLRLRKAADEQEARLKQANSALAAAEKDLLLRLQDQGVTSLKVDLDGRPATVTAATSCYYSLPQGALEDAGVYRWLLRAGGHDLVRRTVHHMSLSAFCRELTEQGRPLHPAVRRAEKKVVRVTGGK